MRFSRCEVRDHINYRKNDRWPSYRFYKALQRLKSPTRDICEIFGAPRFSSFSTQSTQSGHEASKGPNCKAAGRSAECSSMLDLGISGWLDLAQISP